MKAKSQQSDHIFMLSATDWRGATCPICDVHTILKFRDLASGYVFGACCINEMIAATKALSAMENRTNR